MSMLPRSASTHLACSMTNLVFNAVCNCAVRTAEWDNTLSCKMPIVAMSARAWAMPTSWGDNGSDSLTALLLLTTGFRSAFLGVEIVVAA